MICNKFAIICNTQSFARLGRSPIADRHGTPSRCGLIPESIISAFCLLLPTSAHWSSLSKPLICFLKPPFFVGENTCTNTDTHWLAIRPPFFSVWLPIQVWLDPSLFRWFHGFTVSRVRLRNLIRQLSSQQQQLAAVRDECFGRSCEDIWRFPMGDPQSSQ